MENLCPTCGASADRLITNVATGRQFCQGCAARECPSFLANFVLTLQDVLFLIACGIDPEIDPILSFYERVGGSDDTELVRRRKNVEPC